MGTGQQFASKIKTVGCICFLLLFIGFLVMCFTAKPPLPGYVIPQTSEYYAEHLDEFRAELERNMLPMLEGDCSCRVEGGAVAVTVDAEHFDEVSRTVTHYYGSKILRFERG